MGYFDSQIITAEGTELLARANAGETITFTSIIVGDGEYSLSEMAGLDARAGLKNEKQQFPVNGLSVKQNTVCIKSVISNAGLSTGYYIREIGVFAKDESGTEVMLAVSICTGNAATFLPAFQSVPIEIPFTDRISYMGSKESLQIEYASDVYASLADVEETIDNRMTERLGGIGHSTRPVYFNANGVPVPISYTLQSACTKHYTQSVSSGSPELPTSGAVYESIKNHASVEMGKWTPAVNGIYHTLVFPNEGFYTLIGKICMLSFVMKVNGSSDTFSISNLPFPIKYMVDVSGYDGPGVYRLAGIIRTSNNLKVSSSGNSVGNCFVPGCCVSNGKINQTYVRAVDMLTKDSVSILTKKFVTVDNQKLQVGDNHRSGYVNSASDRQRLTTDEPQEIQDAVFAMWGSSPTVQDIEPPQEPNGGGDDV